MKKKEFEVKCIVYKTIKANSLDEANRIMESKYSECKTEYFYDIESNMSYDVIGHCENSGLSIFEHDKFVCDSEGIMWLTDDK